jgi:hypothetical protein
MLFPPILAGDEQAAQDLADRRFRDFGDKHVLARALVIGEARTPAPGVERLKMTERPASMRTRTLAAASSQEFSAI